VAHGTSGADGEPAEQWYWDLRLGRAVPASERGPADQVLGPYPSEAAATAWRDRVEERNESWDEDDERWREGGDPPPGSHGGAHGGQ
jgi:hypothetical protein